MIGRKLLGINEVTEYTGLKTSTVYSWVHQRKIPYIKMGRLVKFDPKEIDLWIQKNSVKVYENE